MNNKETINYYNEEILKRLSYYLNNNSDYITFKMVNSFVKEFSFSEEESIRYILCETLGINIEENMEIFNNYFKNMIKKLDINKYKNNMYYKNIKIDNIRYKDYSFKIKKYNPYELFVYNDLEKYFDGRIIPQIGFFDLEYEYISLLYKDREWMLITPNEIETMDKPIKEATGNVLMYGLGLGYYAYMVSLKENVKKVTIVEKDKDVIELFNKYILNQFECRDKIEVICEDAFEFAKKDEFNYDYVFADIWHDPSDGVEMYKKLKELEKPNIKYSYWIEKTIENYID